VGLASAKKANDDYRIVGTVKDIATDAKRTARKLENEYHLRALAKKAQQEAHHTLQDAKRTAKRLDKKYHLRQKTKKAAQDAQQRINALNKDYQVTDRLGHAVNNGWTKIQRHYDDKK